MPVIVLHAEDAAHDDRVTELVDELREGQQSHGTRLAVAPTEPPQEDPDLDPTAQAVRLLRDLGDSRKWGDRSASYRPYSFPGWDWSAPFRTPPTTRTWTSTGRPPRQALRTATPSANRPRHSCSASSPGSAGGRAGPRAAIVRRC